MNKLLKFSLLCWILAGPFLVSAAQGQEQDSASEKSQELVEDNRKTIKAIYIPLADHYPGIVAYEKYRDQMKHADYQIERMKSWPLLRAYFMSGEVDMAYIICPQAMDMFREKPNFRWVSLLHRDGNALALHECLHVAAFDPAMAANGFVGLDVPGLDPVDDGFRGNITILAGLEDG